MFWTTFWLSNFDNALIISKLKFFLENFFDFDLTKTFPMAYLIVFFISMYRRVKNAPSDELRAMLFKESSCITFCYTVSWEVFQ